MADIRPFNWSDEDYGVIIDIHNAIFPDELDLPELLKHRDEARDQNYMLERVILEVDGVPVGSSSFGESSWTPIPGKFWIYVQVHPDHQRRGYGKAIYDHVVGVLSEKKPTIFDSWTREDKADAVSFLTQRGYEQVMRGQNSRLTLAEFDASKFADVVERVEESGVRIVPLAQLKEQREDEGTAPEEGEGSDSRVPEIVVSTVPAELIFIDGKASLEPVEGNDILKVSNTDSDVVFNIGDQSYYVLLSGRWYRSKDLDRGPWQWVANDEVPLSFSDIPSDSDVGYLRASVAGTDESKDALLEQSIPQTAGVKRGNAESNVEYDGQPKFESVESTQMQYAVNTSSSVILAEGAYYWCEQGIWYVSNTSTGPWAVCDDIPDVIYTIPPSNPLYNVTYVKVYQSTPEVVYVGYTPGYTGSYVSHSCVVYGTGYYYNPWYSPYHYYARPSTWGFHVRWNPWYGWSFGLSYSAGPFHFGVGWGGYGRYGGAWFGPGFYRPYPMPYRGGYRAGYRAGYYHGRHASGRPVHYGGGNTININNNIYNRPANRDRVATTRDRSTGQRPAVARDKANNVYTDRQGNVFKRNDNGSWDKRDKGGWTPNGGTPSSGDRTRPTTRPTTPSTRPAQPSTRPSTPSTRPSSPSTRPSTPSTRPSTGSAKPSTRPSSGSLNRDYSARQRGSTRSSTSRPSSSRSAPRGGGGRRR